MDGFDRQRLLTALILVVMALFVASGLPPVAAPWRRRLRLAAIGGFLVALAVALAEIVMW